MNDREFLEDLARRGGEVEILTEIEQARLLSIAFDLTPRVDVVEQTTAMKTRGAAPDGWSWSDLDKVFTGYYSGIRLQRGEPILEQDGNVLLFRQGETSFTERQVPIYTRLSTLQGVSVIVVFGFMGARTHLTMFHEGKERPMRAWDEGPGLIKEWLKWAHEHPVPGWERKHKRNPPDPKLPLE